MTKRLLIIASLMAAFIFSASPAQADVNRPTGVQVVWTTDTGAAVAWTITKRKYHTVQASRYSDFRVGDHRIDTREQIGILSYLRPNTKYYFRVAVTDHRGKRISPWSKAKVAYTKANWWE